MRSVFQCRSDRGWFVDERGTSLLEMLVSMSLTVGIVGGLFHMAGSETSVFRTQPEVADMSQRVRVARDLIYHDLLMAGAGMDRGSGRGGLANFLPPIRPARRGALSSDGELTAASDRLSVLFVPKTRSQAPLSQTMGAPDSAIGVNTAAPGCGPGGPCGFTAGMRALVFDGTAVGAGYDAFTVTGTSPTTVLHAGSNPAFSKAYAQDDSFVTEVRQRVYYLDSSTRQLMLYDGYEEDVALVDHVVGLSFTFFADPDPNRAPKPPAGIGNCVYDPGDPPVPLLANLGGSAPQPLTLTQMSDGPVCGVAPNRFDGDLLRVRKVGVSIRVEATSEALRGANSADFANPGLSSGGERLVRDYEVSFEVTLRNLAASSKSYQDGGSSDDDDSSGDDSSS